MREGFPSSSTKHVKAESAVALLPERASISAPLSAVHMRLGELMHASGHDYKMIENKDSLSLHADAESFAHLLAHLEALLTEVNRDADVRGVGHLGIIVRGMHAVDVRMTGVS